LPLLLLSPLPSRSPVLLGNSRHTGHCVTTKTLLPGLPSSRRLFLHLPDSLLSSTPPRISAKHVDGTAAPAEQTPEHGVGAHLRPPHFRWAVRHAITPRPVPYSSGTLTPVPLSERSSYASRPSR
jgi:hypothetical protein